MDGSDTTRGRDGAPSTDESASTVRDSKVRLLAIECRSGQGLLKGCGEDIGWRNEGTPCPDAQWTPRRRAPISHTMGKPVRIALTVVSPADGARLTAVRGVGPAGLSFEGPVAPLERSVKLVSRVPLPSKVGKLQAPLRWSGQGASLIPDRSDLLIYVTMGQPRDDQQEVWPEDGVTVPRMDRAISWVAPLGTLHPHSIVEALMARFPFYSLRPSTKVPRKYHHPSYFNDEGGAWPMSEYPDESGECQAIVRLIRGMLRQVGVPGEARLLVVWADPNVENGTKALSAYAEEKPSAGLDTTKVVDGKRWMAALIDSQVEEGKTYPASHTLDKKGVPSPGLNRFEACLEFTHGGVMRLYGGGAGIFPDRESVLEAFWGLVWVSEAPDDGFRVEKIVQRYQE